MDRGRRRHPRRRRFRRRPPPSHAGNRHLPESGSRRQVHRHRHEGLRQDAPPEGETHPVPARGADRVPANREPTRQADRRQDLREGGAGLLRGVVPAVVEALARGDRRGDAQASRPHGRPQGDPEVGGPDGRRAAARRHRPFRSPPRLLAQRAATRRCRHRRPPRCRGCAPSMSPIAIFIDGVDEYFGKHIESRREPPERDGPTLAERMVLRAVGPRRGRLSAAAHQPPPESLRRRAQGSVRASAHHGHGAAVSGERRRYRLSSREPPRDLRQQHPPGEVGTDGPARAAARRPDRGVPRPDEDRARLHRRRRRTRSTTCVGTRCSGRAT